MPASDEMSCQELVELVTDYLENTLSNSRKLKFEEHLKECDGCLTYVEQMRETIRATGRLREEAIAPEVREVLLQLFRNWKLAEQ